MLEKSEFTINDNDDSALLASFPKAEVKIRKLDESKLQLDNNENSLSVDTLIEILSAEKPPTPATASTLSSPSSASSSSGKSKSAAHKFPSPHHLNGGKPMISDMNKKMKQVARRQPKTLYQSKISENKLGIKISIKKATDALKALPSPNKGKRRSRKTKAKDHESDSDDAYVKRRKKSSTAVNNNNNNTTPFDEPVEQSGWGKEMPKEILFDVSWGN